MGLRCGLILSLVLSGFPLVAQGAAYRTTNFLVQAPTPQLAKQFGDWAEYYRREKALLWLGQEMPTWGQPCPLYVHVTWEPPSGATSFNFANGQILGMKMEIQGPLDRLISSVLPHEITHTVFAYYFRCPLPRWADEGGSVLSEDALERERHDKMVRNILNHGQQIRLRTLFSLMQYPPGHDRILCLYAEGYSVADYLVKRSDRQTFLKFVAHGMSYGWDSAVRTYFHHNSIEELEEAWLAYLRQTRGQPHILLAQEHGPQPASAPADPAARTVVRLTVPPAAPLPLTPVYRGQAPEETGAPAAAPVPVHLGAPQMGGSAPPNGLPAPAADAFLPSAGSPPPAASVPPVAFAPAGFLPPATPPPGPLPAATPRWTSPGGLQLP